MSSLPNCSRSWISQSYPPLLPLTVQHRPRSRGAEQHRACPRGKIAAVACVWGGLAVFDNGNDALVVARVDDGSVPLPRNRQREIPVPNHGPALRARSGTTHTTPPRSVLYYPSLVLEKSPFRQKCPISGKNVFSLSGKPPPVMIYWQYCKGCDCRENCPCRRRTPLSCRHGSTLPCLRQKPGLRF